MLPTWARPTPEQLEDLTSAHWLTLVDPSGYYRADVKWDGCVHFHRYHNVPLFGDGSKEEGRIEDYVHFCNLDEEIKRLQALREAARAHFGPAWF